MGSKESFEILAEAAFRIGSQARSRAQHEMFSCTNFVARHNWVMEFSWPGLNWVRLKIHFTFYQ